jgi:hypothetical protein
MLQVNRLSLGLIAVQLPGRDDLTHATFVRGAIDRI